MKLSALCVAAAAAVAAVGAPVEAAIGCRDMDGNPVDWFMAVKIPEVETGPAWYGQGLGFAYMDANSGGQLKEMPKDLTSTTMAISYTLNQIYQNVKSSSVAYLMYNDETPAEKENGSRGHSKGDLAFDADTGFWLIHSVPRWPNAAADGYDFPERETRYGQSFLCLSLETSAFEDVAHQLSFIYPQVYDTNFPGDDLGGPVMRGVAAGTHTRADPFTSVKPLTTLGGADFLSFAKNTAWNSDLYEELVAAHIDDDLRTETWQNGRGKMSSYCKPAKKYSVENIQYIEISPSAGWKSTKDHSKIAMSSPTTGYICIGGVNRQVSQAHRGGGTVCTRIPTAYAAFNAIVDKVEEC